MLFAGEKKGFFEDHGNMLEDFVAQTQLVID